jgi:hypothetical protein
MPGAYGTPRRLFPIANGHWAVLDSSSTISIRLCSPDGIVVVLCSGTADKAEAWGNMTTRLLQSLNSQAIALSRLGVGCRVISTRFRPARWSLLCLKHHPPSPALASKQPIGAHTGITPIAAPGTERA